MLPTAPFFAIVVSGQAQESHEAWGTLLCGAASFICKNLVPFHDIRANDCGLEKRRPDPIR
jgi:hypothetical protein